MSMRNLTLLLWLLAAPVAAQTRMQFPATMTDQDRWDMMHAIPACAAGPLRGPHDPTPAPGGTTCALDASTTPPTLVLSPSLSAGDAAQLQNAMKATLAGKLTADDVAANAIDAATVDTFCVNPPNDKSSMALCAHWRITRRLAKP